MRTYKQIGLDFIRPNSKEGNEDTKKVLWEANDIVYKLGNRPASPESCRRYYNSFLSLAKNLASSTPSPKEEPKWKEVGSSLKSFLSLLIQAADYHYTRSDTQDVQRLLNYTLHSYIEAKNSQEEPLTPQKAIEFLETWQELNQDYVEPFPYINELNLTQYHNMRKELLNYLNDYYNPQDE